jgi:transcriptional regulator with XRE-family HTH domain
VHLIRDLREKKGITQYQLAAAAGISASNLSHIESGKRLATDATIKKIANGFKELGVRVSANKLGRVSGKRVNVSLSVLMSEKLMPSEKLVYTFIASGESPRKWVKHLSPNKIERGLTNLTKLNIINGITRAIKPETEWEI